MATSLYSLLKDHQVVIPIVQRDYAQGREHGKAPVIREVFLNALRKAITDTEKNALELDFVYGYVQANEENTFKKFIPLDGQQRLTTLFLLHWFIAVKENKVAEAKDFLSNFTYETRHSSKVFCEHLCGRLSDFVNKDLNGPIKDTIINEPWFFTAWKNDPTVSSMLTMLDAIQTKFKDLDDVWPLLTSDQARIVFHLLPMERLGLPDDLYIKMNSRGKELTEFEHFKSRFSEILSADQAVIFNDKIDKDWSDLFWNLYKDRESHDIAKMVDNGFLRFYNFITDVLIYKNDIQTSEAEDEFETYKLVYSQPEHVHFLFSSLEALCRISEENPGFFKGLFYTHQDQFSENKTRLFFNNRTANLFKKCADSYDAKNRTNPFSIGEQLMLFACLEHLIHSTEEINFRLRTLRNLITNSEDTVRRENMPSLLNSVSELVLNNSLDKDSKFNSRQIEEELNKQQFIKQNPNLREAIFKAEDQDLLQGCIAIFKLDAEIGKYTAAFLRVFTSGCDFDSISRALMCFGDYSQRYDHSRKRFGNSNELIWRELFTPSQRRGGFGQTQDVLYDLLSCFIQNPQTDLETIILDYSTSFLNDPDKPKGFRYYFVHYREFRGFEQGFYHWYNNDKKYEAIMLRKTILGGFHWSPFLLELFDRINCDRSLDSYGAPLVISKGNASLRIKTYNIGFKVEANDEEGKLWLEAIRQAELVNQNDIIRIVQNEEGLDLEDRIEKGVQVLSELLALDNAEPVTTNDLSVNIAID